VRRGGGKGRDIFVIDAGDTKDNILSCENTLRFAEQIQLGLRKSYTVAGNNAGLLSEPL